MTALLVQKAVYRGPPAAALLFMESCLKRTQVYCSPNETVVRGGEEVGPETGRQEAEVEERKKNKVSDKKRNQSDEGRNIRRESLIIKDIFMGCSSDSIASQDAWI